MDDRYFVPGSFYRICDRTGFKMRAGRTRKQWDNTIVRQESWEARHPQDFVRGVADQQTAPEPRPRTVDRFIEIPVLLTASGLPTGYGVPLYTAHGGLIYRAGGLAANEVAPVDPSQYPKSA